MLHCDFQVQLANSNQLGHHCVSKHPEEKPPAESSWFILVTCVYFQIPGNAFSLCFRTVKAVCHWTWVAILSSELWKSRIHLCCCFIRANDKFICLQCWFSWSIDVGCLSIFDVSNIGEEQFLSDSVTKSMVMWLKHWKFFKLLELVWNPNGAQRGGVLLWWVYIIGVVFFNIFYMIFILFKIIYFIDFIVHILGSGFI